MTNDRIRLLLSTEHSLHADVSNYVWLIERAETWGFRSLSTELQKELKPVTSALRDIQKQIADASIECAT